MARIEREDGEDRERGWELCGRRIHRISELSRRQLETESIFRITAWDMYLLYVRRNRDPPPSLMTPELKYYLDNFKKWSEQLRRRAEEEKPEEEPQALVEKPEAGADAAEGEGCGADQTGTSS